MAHRSSLSEKEGNTYCAYLTLRLGNAGRCLLTNATGREEHERLALSGTILVRPKRVFADFSRPDRFVRRTPYSSALNYARIRSLLPLASTTCVFCEYHARTTREREEGRWWSRCEEGKSKAIRNGLQGGLPFQILAALLNSTQAFVVALARREEEERTMLISFASSRHQMHSESPPLFVSSNSPYDAICGASTILLGLRIAVTIHSLLALFPRATHLEETKTNPRRGQASHITCSFIDHFPCPSSNAKFFSPGKAMMNPVAGADAASQTAPLIYAGHIFGKWRVVKQPAGAICLDGDKQRRPDRCLTRRCPGRGLVAPAREKRDIVLGRALQTCRARRRGVRAECVHAEARSRWSNAEEGGDALCAGAGGEGMVIERACGGIMDGGRTLGSGNSVLPTPDRKITRGSRARLIYMGALGELLVHSFLPFRKTSPIANLPSPRSVMSYAGEYYPSAPDISPAADHAVAAPPTGPGPAGDPGDPAPQPSARVTLRRCCFNCWTTDTSGWRLSKLSAGKIVCDECGLFERRHKRPRPVRFRHERPAGYVESGV
ncbi:Gata transcription factor [Mycena indigotica]|uniref:Gata transcription factor n=1 Tax=Mycena indigotica TaxID=2126181 RepID=A0A8H6VZ87_9AGAR|nr:Gata transcription factor [Mycena indigotica]KAF7295728.1 Gata transcription factor [Mycena indigotica]